MTWTIHEGDVLAVLKTMRSDSFDACLCDPPYGLKFMGKAWDHGVPSAKVWAEVARVLKPGAPLMAFGATRMFHRLFCAIEDAGLALNDTIAWIYGQGYPKSLDLSKAIDKKAGATREVVGSKLGQPGYSLEPSRGTSLAGLRGVGGAGAVEITAPATDLARDFDGHGTALKPSWESVAVARKPSTLDDEIAAVARDVLEAVCLLSSRVTDAESLSPSSRAALAPLDSALWDAARACSTPADLCGLMATSRSESATPSSLSIACSWLGILADLSRLASTCTTETIGATTTDLRTLRSSPSRITPDVMLEAASRTHGTSSSASLAELTFAAVASRLALTRASSARGAATSSVVDRALRPDFMPIALATKALDGTYVDNVRRWGVGGLAIDASRIDRAKTPAPTSRGDSAPWFTGASGDNLGGDDAKGGWPGNVILDEAAGQSLDAMSGTSRSVGGYRGAGERAGTGWGMGGDPLKTPVGYGDEGGASRFFYCPKVSRFEREFGCERLPMRTVDEAVGRKKGSKGAGNARAGASRKDGARNHHPTLKPIDLARYLARLMLPPSSGVPRRILVPFSGAASEMIGCMRAGWEVVEGIENDPAYLPIARARIARWLEVPADFELEDIERTKVDPRQVSIFDVLERVGS